MCVQNELWSDADGSGPPDPGSEDLWEVLWRVSWRDLTRFSRTCMSQHWQRYEEGLYLEELRLVG